MATKIQCPNPACQQNVSVDDSIVGRKVRCKKCGTAYQATPTLDGTSRKTIRSTTPGETGLFPSLP